MFQLNSHQANIYALIFTTSVSVWKGRGQHAVIKLRIRIQGMTNEPIRAKQVNRSSSMIDHIGELASEHFSYLSRILSIVLIFGAVKEFIILYLSILLTN